tara:strand:- start:13617 stop:13916 length:300 start_codon:yes stop_codon:yes gene_type:complete
MKLTKERLGRIIREEIQKEEDRTYGFSPTPPSDQGKDPSNVKISEAIDDLENARIIVALALPELLEQLDYVITKMKGLGSFPSDNISAYTMYEENTDEE